MIYTEEEAKKLVAESGRRLVKAGLTARTWGNISARISDTQFVITPSGIDYELLTAEDIVTVNIADCSYEGDRKPSSEKGVHAAIYRQRPQAGFIVHTHQTYATAVSIDGRDIAGYGEPYRSILGSVVPCAEYAISSTKPLARNVEKTAAQFPRSKAILMKNHGTVCIGASVDEAFEIAMTLEKLAKRKLAIRLGLSRVDCSLMAALIENYEAYYELTATYELFDLKGLAEEYATISGMTVLVSETPAMRAVSAAGCTIPAIIDDMAQIAGTDVHCLKKKWLKPGTVSHSLQVMRRLKALLSGRSVVYVEGFGALCVADCMEEAEAVRIVAEKNAVAELYTPFATEPYLGEADANLQHLVYKKKYSRLKKG